MLDEVSTTEDASAEASGRKARPFLSFHQPLIGQEEIDEVVDTLRSGWLTTGPKTQKFEQAFAHYVGSEYAVAVNSCTAGLHLALAAAKIGAGDEVITTPYTFAATAEVIMYTGAKPVLVDIEPQGFNIDVSKIERAITPRTRAIIPVHFAGQPCDMDAISDIARRHNVMVIEDAAHAVAADHRGKKIGTISPLTVFSFYATKNLTTGEGGMVTTNDRALSERVRSLSLHGLSRDAWKRYSKAGSWYYEILHLGYKYNLTDIQSAIGLHQLAKIEKFLEARRRLVEAYDQSLAELPEVIPPPHGTNCRHGWHLYVIRLKTDKLTINRDEVIQQLAERGIGTSVHFIPLHLHPYYRTTFGWAPGDFPNALRTYESAISLPLYPQMELNDVRDRVVATLKRIIAENRR
jgi:UDP-4-amino-4,6-dideoxy-N-acetyl-beta-L-altrosamine transaminase